MPAKSWPCMVCEKRYAELEEAEVCERSHGQKRKTPKPTDGLSFTCGFSVRGGKFFIEPGVVARAVKAWPDCVGVLTLEPDEAKRSSAANRYLWGPVYEAIHALTGQPKQDIHDEMCARFTTETVSYVNPLTGELVSTEVVRRTSGMKVSRFYKFVQDVKLFASEFFGIVWGDEPDDVQVEYRRAVARERKAAA